MFQFPVYSEPGVDRYIFGQLGASLVPDKYRELEDQDIHIHVQQILCAPNPWSSKALP